MIESTGKPPKVAVGFHTCGAQAGFDCLDPICETVYLGGDLLWHPIR